jgi:hypothetical protein
MEVTEALFGDTLVRSGYRIGVVIPALDEEEAIGRVVAAVPDWVDEVVVVDNGSRDATGKVALAAGARLVTETERGYGAACLAGIAALTSPDIIVFLDGDFSDDPREMHLLVDPIAADQSDFVVGSRVRGERERGSLTIQQRTGNWLACLLMRRLWNTEWSDLGPFRAIRASSLRRLGMRDRRYGWTVEMQLNAARAALRQKEVSVSYRRRIGTSKISGTIKGALLAAFTILRLIARSATERTTGSVRFNDGNGCG